MPISNAKQKTITTTAAEILECGMRHLLLKFPRKVLNRSILPVSVRVKYILVVLENQGYARIYNSSLTSTKGPVAVVCNLGVPTVS
jgi:hypothetical protein